MLTRIVDNDGVLELEKVRQVKELLDSEELSQRKIAKQVGVSRGTVKAIACGARGLWSRDDPLVAPSDEAVEYIRCAGCGKLVTLPCHFCAAQAYQRRVAQGILEPANHAQATGLPSTTRPQPRSPRGPWQCVAPGHPK